VDCSLPLQLRLLCRDEVGLIEQRTAFINQLRHALAEYYPTALAAFEDWERSGRHWECHQRWACDKYLRHS
jgi:hypothetical protein